MKKVYCENCKYRNKERVRNKLPDEIFSFKILVIDVCGINDNWKDMEGKYIICDLINSQYDCLNYKRKWWKFWIKEG